MGSALAQGLLEVDLDTLEYARARYFAAAGIPAHGGYDDPWVSVSFGPLQLPLPNIPARRKVVAQHDLHHALTGYDATLRGEAEMAAWEVASGCGLRWQPWFINLHAIAVGLVIAPRRTSRAFARGFGAQNLFGKPVNAELLARPLRAVRQELGIPPGNVPMDATRAFAFAACSAASIAMASMSVACSPLLAAGLALLGRHCEKETFRPAAPTTAGPEHEGGQRDSDPGPIGGR